jgi:uncharacterized repeat protein (TIGR01451 family)
VTSSCCPSPSPRSRRGRFIPAAFVLLAGLALSLTPFVEARAQQSTADITVTKSSEEESVRVGGIITYSLAVSNAGPGAATNVVLTDAIPAYTTYVSHEVTTGNGTASFDGTTLTATFASLPAPDPETGFVATGGVRLMVRVNADAPRGTVITNTVTGTASSNDPQTFDNSATATTAVSGPFPGDLLISEFRLRGPAGATDEYIEVYNNADAPHLVQSTDDSQGYAIVASDGALRCTIPNETVIPARGHFLCANSLGYSLTLYPAGEGTTATPDATYTADIPDNAGLALFRTSDSEGFNAANRFDAVGSTSVTNGLYREGAGYPALSPLGLDYAFYRDNCGKSGSITAFGNCPSLGLPRDTDNNAADFVFVSPDGNSSGAGARLGAPGPENLSSPTQRNGQFAVTLLDPCVSSSSPPNRARTLTSDPVNNSTFGTLEIRRTVTNMTGENVTRLRWRIVDITTHPAPSGIADLRARTSTPVPVTVDRPPCGSGTSEVVVQGTTLEQPPLQTLGGGFNSTLSSGTITLDAPLLDAQSIDVRFLLGIQQTGRFKFFINVEALTREPEIIVPEEELPSERPSPTGAPSGPTVRPRKGLVALTSETGVSAPPAATSQSVSAPPVNASNGVNTMPVRTYVVVRVIPPKESAQAGEESEPTRARSSKAKKRKRAAAKARQSRRE